jgi:hypothetical protein
VPRPSLVTTKRESRGIVSGHNKKPPDKDQGAMFEILLFLVQQQPYATSGGGGKALIAVALSKKPGATTALATNKGSV